MGDVDKGRAGVDVQPLELRAHLQPQLGVQIGQRLVHEEHRGLGGQGAGDSHPLLLSAGELGGITVHEHADFDDAGHPADREVDLLRGELAHAGHRHAVLEVGEILPEGAALGGARRPGALQRLFQLLQSGLGHGDRLHRLVELIAHQGLGGVEGDLIAVDELDVGLVHVQPALFVHTLPDGPNHVVRPLQDADEGGGPAGLQVELRQLLLDVAQTEGDVLVDRHVGPQGVVLEQEAHLPLIGRDVDASVGVEHHLVANGDAAAGGGLQPGDHAQRGGLAAARGAQQRDEGVVVDDQIQVVHGVEFVPALGHVGEYNLRHGLTSYPFVQAGAGHFVDKGVADENGDDQDQIDAAGEGV